ncbi:MAG: mandelate racemase/muconate lactonizing enzyme family protein [Acidobacteriota bacterium]
MKITGVQAFWLRYPIPELRQHTSDFGRLRTFDSTVVRVQGEGGLSGYGEAKAAVGSAAMCAPLLAIVNESLRPLLLGEDSRDISRLWEIMYSGVRAPLALEAGRSFPELDRRGSRIAAMSGVDMALWDLKGKELGLPVYELLGGRCRDKITAYASGGWANASEIGAQLQQTIEPAGFKAVKMRVGAMDGTVANSIARVGAARKALGPEIRLMVDAHGTWNTRSAMSFCRAAEDFDVSWIEEPVSADDLKGLKEVRDSTVIPIATGESLATRFDFRDVIDARAADILQPDPAIAGGITEVARIAAYASAHQLTLAPHLWGSALLFASGLHLAAALPNVVTLEYSMGFNPMLRELCRDPFVISNGDIHLPKGPGLGVTINEEFVRAYSHSTDR